MTPLRWVGLLVGVAVIGVTVTAFSLSRDWEISSGDIVMPVPASEVEPYLLDLRLWKKWAIPEDVAGSWKFEGAERGVGAGFTFESDRAGKRRLLITNVKSEEDMKVITYTFGIGDEGDPVEGTLTLSQRDGNGVVRWDLAGEAPEGMLSGFLALATNLQGPRDLEQSLKKLSKILLDEESSKKSE